MLDPRAHRESARTTDPTELAVKIDKIRQNLNHSKRRRYEELTAPLTPTERFDHTEQQLETERDRHN